MEAGLAIERSDPGRFQQPHQFSVEILDIVLPARGPCNHSRRQAAEIYWESMQGPPSERPLHPPCDERVARSTLGDDAEGEMHAFEASRLTSRLCQLVERRIESRMRPNPKKITVEMRRPHRPISIRCSLYVLPSRESIRLAANGSICSLAKSPVRDRRSRSVGSKVTFRQHV